MVLVFSYFSLPLISTEYSWFYILYYIWYPIVVEVSQPTYDKLKVVQIN
jgi:hypothetical protein